MKYDFSTNLKRKVQINIDEWINPDSSLITVYKMSGKNSVTGITRVCSVGSDVQELSEGDIVFLSQVGCSVAMTPTAYYTVDNKRFFNLPVEQVLGIFKHGCINLKSFQVLDKIVLFKRTEKCRTSLIDINDKNTLMGKVVLSGKDAPVNIGETIIVRDNVSTPITMDGEQYFAVESKFIVGRFLNTTESLENLTVLNKHIIFEAYTPSKVLNSTILETALIDYSNFDYSDVQNLNLFKVLYIDETLNNIKKGDIILIDRFYTHYMYFDNKKYFVINDEKWISGKIIERDNV